MTRTVLFFSSATVLMLGIFGTYILNSEDATAQLRRELQASAVYQNRERERIIEASEVIDNTLDLAAIASGVGALPALVKKGVIRIANKITKAAGKSTARTMLMRSAMNSAPQSVQQTVTGYYRTWALGGAGYKFSPSKAVFTARVDRLTQSIAHIQRAEIDPDGNLNTAGHELEHIVPKTCCWSLGWSSTQCANHGNLRVVRSAFNRSVVRRHRAKSCTIPKERDVLSGVAWLDKQLNARPN
jgi:hypothetical protein